MPLSHYVGVNGTIKTQCKAWLSLKTVKVSREDGISICFISEENTVCWDQNWWIGSAQTIHLKCYLCGLNYAALLPYSFYPVAYPILSQHHLSSFDRSSTREPIPANHSLTSRAQWGACWSSRELQASLWHAQIFLCGVNTHAHTITKQHPPSADFCAPTK